MDTPRREREPFKYLAARLVIRSARLVALAINISDIAPSDRNAPPPEYVKMLEEYADMMFELLEVATTGIEDLPLEGDNYVTL